MIIYKTTNLINNKIYIGQDSKNNSNYYGSGVIIKRALIKYGKDNFKKEIIDICETQKSLNKKEQFWIKHYNSTNKNIGYNITEGGDGCLGLKHNEFTKKLMSKLRMGNKYALGSKRSEFTKNLMKINNTGNKNPMYNKSLSKKILKERSIKVKQNGTFKGKNNPNFKFNIDEFKLKQMFLNDDKTIQEIANYFKCSRDVINNNLRTYNINKPKSNKYNLNINDINKYINQGLTQVEIGELYGCSNKYINKYIKKYKSNE